MIIKNIKINNFRNITKMEINPGPKMNLIFGENGQGKTNVLEAIWLFCGAKSFRQAKDKEMLMFNKNVCKNFCVFESENIQKNSAIIIDEKRKAEFLNKPVRPSSLAKDFHTVVFSPQDLNLISGSGEKRRRFLNLAISSITPKYIEYLREYNRILLQRNTLLKQISEKKSSGGLLEPFEIKMAEVSQKIVYYRSKYCEKLEKEAQKLYFGISNNKEKLTLEYISDFNKNTTKEEIFLSLKNSRNNDILNKNTSIGPKKDDILVLINEKSAKSYGSQGQKRSAALCLKLAEAEIMKNAVNENPVALLDDCLSELDINRQHFILNHLTDWQVFLTACDPANINILKSGTVFKIEKGELCTYT